MASRAKYGPVLLLGEVNQRSMFGSRVWGLFSVSDSFRFRFKGTLTLRVGPLFSYTAFPV